MWENKRKHIFFCSFFIFPLWRITLISSSHHIIISFIHSYCLDEGRKSSVLRLIMIIEKKTKDVGTKAWMRWEDFPLNTNLQTFKWKMKISFFFPYLNYKFLSYWFELDWFVELLERPYPFYVKLLTRKLTFWRNLGISNDTLEDNYPFHHHVCFLLPFSSFNKEFFFL